MKEFWKTFEEKREKELEVGEIRRAIEEAQAAIPYLRSRGPVSAVNRAIEDIVRLRATLREATMPKPRWIPFNPRQRL